MLKIVFLLCIRLCEIIIICFYKKKKKLKLLMNSQYILLPNGCSYFNAAATGLVSE